MKFFATSPDIAISRLQRVLLVAFGLTGLFLLTMAGNLEPDPRGYGTHEQLGLTPCYFQLKTGTICPTCGATTAWAHTLRGNITQAVAANLGGTILCVLVILAVPWSLISAVKGSWLGVRPAPKIILIIATALLAMTVLDWLRRCFLS